MSSTTDRTEHRKLLVLDLDETLVFGTETPLSRPADFSVGAYHMYTRPGLGEFLTSCFRWFHVGVWTSSTEPYARDVVRAIMGERPLAILWCRDRCTRRFDGEAQMHYWVKDLRKLKRMGFRLEDILIVDDTPQKAERNYGNHIRVSEWQGDETDDELLLLKEFLNTLRTIPSVRTVEKRGWRTTVRP